MKRATDQSVLLIAPHPFFSERGTPIAVRDMARILTEDGWRVTVLTYPYGEDPGLEGIEVIRSARVPFLKRVGIGLNFPKLIADAFLWFKLIGLLFRRRFAVYHAVEESVFLAYAAALVFPARVVYDMDSCMGDQIVEKFQRLSPCRGGFRWAERWVMRRVDWILPVCPALGDIAAELAPKTGQTVLHDLPPKPSGTRQHGVLNLKSLAPADAKIALYVGNFESYQGVDLLIGAVERMRPEVAIQVILVGGGARQEELKRRVNEGPARGRIAFAGPQPLAHLPFLLEQADILLSPRCKGVNTPMKIYAYLAAGRAILATKILSHTQVVGEAECFLVEPEEKAMAAGLESLAESDERREAIGNAARKLWATSFSRERLRDKVLSAYENILKDPGDESIPEASHHPK